MNKTKVILRLSPVCIQRIRNCSFYNQQIFSFLSGQPHRRHLPLHDNGLTHLRCRSQMARKEKNEIPARGCYFMTQNYKLFFKLFMNHNGIALRPCLLIIKQPCNFSISPNLNLIKMDNGDEFAMK